MKTVLLVFPLDDVNKVNLGNDIKSAFEELRYHVVALDTRRFREGQILSLAKQHKPFLIFCSRTYSIIEDLRRVKEDLPAKIACWTLDILRDYAEAHPLFEVCDVVFDSCYTLVQEHKKRGLNSVWLPAAAGKTFFKTKPGYDYDIAFAGSIEGHPAEIERKEIIDYIATNGFDLGLFGSSYPKVRLSELNAKINLGHNYGWKWLTGYRSARDYRILSGNKFLLSTPESPPEEEPHPLKPYIHFVPYETKEDCVDKIISYLKYGQERERIAKQGRDHVLKYHTLNNRMEKVIWVLK